MAIVLVYKFVTIVMLVLVDMENSVGHENEIGSKK